MCMNIAVERTLVSPSSSNQNLSGPQLKQCSEALPSACDRAGSDAVGKLDPGSYAIHALHPPKACKGLKGIQNGKDCGWIQKGLSLYPALLKKLGRIMATSRRFRLPGDCKLKEVRH